MRTLQTKVSNINETNIFFEKYGFKYYGKKGKEEAYERNIINLIKVISLKEPWASLVKEGVKHIETRSWATKYRGELYIHASKRKLTNKDLITYKEQLSLLSDCDFQYGHIVAKCKLVDCKGMTKEFIEEIKKDHNEYISGEYAINRYAWILKDIEILENPIETNGQLGIWSYNNIKN